MKETKAKQIRALLSLGKAMSAARIAKRVGCDVSYVYSMRHVMKAKQQTEANEANEVIIKWNNTSYKFSIDDAPQAFESIKFLNAHAKV